MSRIEDEAIAVTSALIKDQEIRFDENEQRRLAALLCLITMRLEFLSHMRAIPLEDRLHLKQYGEPPKLWTIWITKYLGEKADDHWSRFCAMQVGSTPPDKVGAVHCNTQVTTMVIGKLCAHLFSSTVSPIIGYEGIRLARIWPLTGLGIDSRFIPGIDDKAVVWLHEALARESKPVPR